MTVVYLIDCIICKNNGGDKTSSSTIVTDLKNQKIDSLRVLSCVLCMPTSKYRPLDSFSNSDFQSKMDENYDISGGPKTNKYAFACAILASMSSVLLGYGKRFHLLAYFQFPM